jgi:outer membrane protein OmpA-like peptidoglycan-associated protein
MGSEKLGQNELNMMEETVMFLKNFPQYNVIIYGHACDIGTTERNYIISLKRADEARTLLIRRGIEAGRIAIVGMGSDQPKVPNTSEENRMINRRIEVFKFIAR